MSIYGTGFINSNSTEGYHEECTAVMLAEYLPGKVEPDDIREYSEGRLESWIVCNQIICRFITKDGWRIPSPYMYQNTVNPDAIVKELLSGVKENSNIIPAMEKLQSRSNINYISLAEYAQKYKRALKTIRDKAQSGGFKTAKKIGRNWVIAKNEPFTDNRVTSGKYKKEKL